MNPGFRLPNFGVVPRTDLRRVLNALLTLGKAGCPWSMLPLEFQPGKTVFHIFRSWIRDKVWESINAS